MRSGFPRHVRRGSFTLWLVLSVAVPAATVAYAAPGGAMPFGPISLHAIDAGWTGDMVAMTSSVFGRITAIPESASCLLFGTGVSALLALRRRSQRRPN